MKMCLFDLSWGFNLKRGVFADGNSRAAPLDLTLEE